MIDDILILISKPYSPLCIGVYVAMPLPMVYDILNRLNHCKPLPLALGLLGSRPLVSIEKPFKSCARSGE